MKLYVNNKFHIKYTYMINQKYSYIVLSDHVSLSHICKSHENIRSSKERRLCITVMGTTTLNYTHLARLWHEAYHLYPPKL